MLLAETIYEHSLSLPEAAAREVLDFIDFLTTRYEKPALLSAKAKNKRLAEKIAGIGSGDAEGSVDYKKHVADYLNAKFNHC